jgi:hypothetical protein
MLITAFVLLGLAALGGSVLARQATTGTTPSMPLAVGHGLLAGAGLVVLLIAFVRGEAGGLVTAALVLFVLAALGGFYLVATHVRGQPLPKAVIAGHATAASVGLVLLLAALVT